MLLSPETARRINQAQGRRSLLGRPSPHIPICRGHPQVQQPTTGAGGSFKPAAEKAGIPWATPHKLRRGLASLMAASGLSAAQIAAHLGHADGGVLALRTYIHADQLDSADFIDRAYGEDL